MNRDRNVCVIPSFFLMRETKRLCVGRRPQALVSGVYRPLYKSLSRAGFTSGDKHRQTGYARPSRQAHRSPCPQGTQWARRCSLSMARYFRPNQWRQHFWRGRRGVRPRGRSQRSRA